MRKLNQEEMTLIVSLYRSFRSNPKNFKLADTSRETLMGIIDVKYFDLGHSYGYNIVYAGFSTGHFLQQRIADAFRGEEFRNVEKSINAVSKHLAKDTLKSLRSGTIPDDILVVTAYIHLGIAHEILPHLKDSAYRSQIWYDLETEEKMPNGQAN